MPVKGTVRAIGPEQRLMNMPVGELAYIHVEAVAITEKAIFINLNTYVVYHKDIIGGFIYEHVPITRLSDGLTEDDFELDVEKLGAWNEFVLHGTDTAELYLRAKNQYLIFNTFEMEKLRLPVSECFESREAILESLNADLEKAVENQNFEEATELRGKIEALEQKKP